jgi:hypothetical protein
MDPNYDAGSQGRFDIPGKVMAYEALGKVRAEWVTVSCSNHPTVPHRTPHYPATQVCFFSLAAIKRTDTKFLKRALDSTRLT